MQIGSELYFSEEYQHVRKRNSFTVLYSNEDGGLECRVDSLTVPTTMAPLECNCCCLILKMNENFHSSIGKVCTSR